MAEENRAFSGIRLEGNFRKGLLDARWRATSEKGFLMPEREREVGGILDLVEIKKKLINHEHNFI